MADATAVPGASGCPRRAFLRSGAYGTAGLGAAAFGAVGTLTGCSDEQDDGAEAVHEGSDWQAASSAEDLPVGSTADAEVAGYLLVLHRAADDEVHAFEAVCTHEGCRVEAEQERYYCPVSYTHLTLPTNREV